VPAVSAEAVYKGFRADALIGQDVYGLNGNQIGEVQEILVNKDGQITSIVVEGGGFLDIGDAAFRIPWSEVDLTPGKEGIVARNMTEAKAEKLGLFDGPETVLTGPREFRVGELTGDWALLRNGQGYGYVRDVVFSREARRFRCSSTATRVTGPVSSPIPITATASDGTRR
jgi:sporulation protein YlmC with PRC-barrel domain